MFVVVNLVGLWYDVVEDFGGELYYVGVCDLGVVVVVGGFVFFVYVYLFEGCCVFFFVVFDWDKGVYVVDGWGVMFVVGLDGEFGVVLYYGYGYGDFGVVG